jgi:POLQ-like helicase
MKPEQASKTLLGITRSKAKMYEYGVPEEHHIKIPRDPLALFRITIGLLGDAAAEHNRQQGGATKLQDRRTELLFAARFFDAYLETRLRSELDTYLLLLAASTFYLCDFPGSSHILASKCQAPVANVDGEGLEVLLHWLLLGAHGAPPKEFAGQLGEQLSQAGLALERFYETGDNTTGVFQAAAALRSVAYRVGTPRQLLLADVASAVIRQRHANSTWQCVPTYSGLPKEAWSEVLKKPGFMRELWPSQQLLGEKGVLKGASAIVQMPTSAGKTRATELIIRSAFLAGRTSSAVIVAPFRALCHEISDALKAAFRGEGVVIDELTDVMQIDFDMNFDLDAILDTKKVLVVTPEKLVYVLRHSPELADSVGLVIYDEGHQFDSGLRGVTYELLLASLRRLIPKTAQSVLISAVISNAESVGQWMHGDEPVVASGRNLTPMYRTIAFASWVDQLGQLKFVADDDTLRDEFFVPRVISSQQLQNKPREKKKRYFPDREDGQSVALYLGTKLVAEGSVAIFCGRKATAASLCERIVDAYERGFALPKPIQHSNEQEVLRIAALYARNIGPEADATKSAAIGVFSHHGNTPHGIRLAVEHAMKSGQARFVVCTSTLAQGVNLPIRYLLVTSVYQGQDKIKVRDFHNLIGRAGRAGMHTEGTIVFADPDVYDKKEDRKERWRWGQIQELLEPKNSEPVLSSLKTLFEPLKNDEHSFGRKVTLAMTPLQFLQAYMEGRSYLERLVDAVVKQHSDKGFTKKSLDEQVAWRDDVFATIESYLMSYWEGAEGNGFAQELAKGTLAYFLSSDEEKVQLVEIFELLANHIRRLVPDEEKRKVFGRTLQGLTRIVDLEAWIDSHINTLAEIEEHETLLRHLWPVIADGIGNGTFRKCERPELLLEVAIGWLKGVPFHELFAYLRANDVRITAGKQRRELTIEHVVEICESAFSYDGALLIGAVSDLLTSRSEEKEVLVQSLNELHKRFKYGLPASSAIALYECGFADRAIASDLSIVIGVAPKTRSSAIGLLRENENVIRGVLRKYPDYFGSVLSALVA